MPEALCCEERSQSSQCLNLVLCVSLPAGRLPILINLLISAQVLATFWLSCCHNVMTAHAVQFVLTPGGPVPGECLPLNGTNGEISIRLREPIIPTAITYEHVPSAITFDFRSAPNDVTVVSRPSSSTALAQLFMIPVIGWSLCHACRPDSCDSGIFDDCHTPSQCTIAVNFRAAGTPDHELRRRCHAGGMVV